MEKLKVINPIQYFTTVGEEIEDILSSNEISMDSFLSSMKWNDKELKSIMKISKSEAKKIEDFISVGEISSYILNFQNDYKSSKESAENTYKDNLKIYKKLEHLLPLLRNEFSDGIDVLEDISNFLGIDEESEILDKVKENIALYKISNFVPDDLNLYAWLRRGELDFFQKKLELYNKGLFTEWLERKEWKNNLTNLEYISQLPKILETYGVALVYTPYLEKTVFGAVRWFENRPLVQVSDKGKCLATFWYTLFHEFGHVIKHENDEIFEGQADLSKSSINKKEKEANSFAYDYLFNGDNLRKYLFGQRNKSVQEDFIHDMSARFGVNKMFVAFWMKKARIRSWTTKDYMPPFQIK
ncbi:Zn-dependent peptidase ImmA (M78 family) [Flavobacterium gossypii]|uniref:Zn-dependent peptidase ImmA (M78 family) n=1 Tax=Flavobacterium gossypii TaxID=1646119 RepID=A0ABR6DLP0_9FLAO|nr:ImmA/IrrE family metallo-endopeptidase [Flavobacterium gossypii]MBA9072600.1 Zn-dependent peptidase ImmA (M78 family) [Flavobacterium gossypii]